jgi:hypothetical protein
MVIVPFQAQLHVESSVRAFTSPRVTSDEPGDHGAVTTGRHGIGVSVPEAAVVAAATWGFAWVLHIPNGAMFTIGTLSITVLTGWSSTAEPFAGGTEKDEGDVP